MRSATLVVLLAIALAACGGAARPAPPTPVPVPMATDAQSPTVPPPDAADRKHAFSRLPTEVAWNDNTAPLAPDVRFQRVQQGSSFDIADGPVIVVAGKVTNVQNQAVVYWAKKPHRIQCAKGADCILFVHANAAADSKELLDKDVQWAQLDPSRPDPLVSPLWGDGTAGPNGFLMKMKAGGAPFWHIHKYDYQGVVLVGNVISYESGTQPRTMPPGSYWWQPGGNKHTTDCEGPSDCVIYLDFTGAFDVKAVP